MLSITLLMCMKRMINSTHKRLFRNRNGVIDPIISLSDEKG
jgi:hypothetical protein